MNMYKPHEARFCAGQFFSGTKNSASQGLAVHANQKTQKLVLALLENAGKVLKGRKGFRNAGKVLEMQERFCKFVGKVLKMWERFYRREKVGKLSKFQERF